LDQVRDKKKKGKGSKELKPSGRTLLLCHHVPFSSVHFFSRMGFSCPGPDHFFYFFFFVPLLGSVA